METLQSSSPGSTLPELEASNFAGLENALIEDLIYLKSIASVANIDLSKTSILEPVKALPRGDRGALNTFIFSQEAPKPEKPDLSAFESSFEALTKALVEFENNELLDAEGQYNYFRDQARAYQRNIESKLNEMNRWAHKIAILNAAPKGHLGESVKKEIEQITASPFWTLELVHQNEWEFRTRNDVFMTEKADEAGVNRTLNFGKYIARVNFIRGSILVRKYSNNLTTVRGFYHPYIDGSGGICWGNAKDTFYKLTKDRQWSKIMDLLASLLTTYSTSSTPWEDFEAFHRTAFPTGTNTPVQQARDARASRCSRCDRIRDVEIAEELGSAHCECYTCEVCAEHQDHCTCHYCEACDVRYADGDSCEGSFCDACESCIGQDNYCEEHHCFICGEDSRPNCCCQDCENPRSECTCCQECQRAEGHTEGCSLHPSNQPQEEESNETENNS